MDKYKYKYINYANDLMLNNDLEYDEYSVSTESDSPNSINNIFVGGNNKAKPLTQNTSKPSGGFPPIYLCEFNDNDVEDKMKREYKRKREYKTHKTAISISEIMQRRRDVQPFI